MKQVKFLQEVTHEGTTFRPADGITTIVSDLAIPWKAQGIVEIVGDGCGCGETVPDVEIKGATKQVFKTAQRPAPPEEA